jgi:hypothetical protein
VESASGKPNIESALSLWTIAIWLAIQLAALALCASRFMFWARSIAVSEQLALHAIIAVQIASASLLFPHLLRTWRSTILAMVSGIVLAQLAGELADIPPKSLLFAEIYVVGWLAGLHLLSRSLPTDLSRLIASSLVTMISVGGPVLWYLRADFSGADSANLHVPSISVFGPVAGGISQIGPDRSFIPWVFVGIVFAVGGIQMLRNSARRKIS